MGPFFGGRWRNLSQRFLDNTLGCHLINIRTLFTWFPKHPMQGKYPYLVTIFIYTFWGDEWEIYAIMAEKSEIKMSSSSPGSSFLTPGWVSCDLMTWFSPLFSSLVVCCLHPRLYPFSPDLTSSPPILACPSQKHHRVYRHREKTWMKHIWLRKRPVDGRRAEKKQETQVKLRGTGRELFHSSCCIFCVC